MLWTRSKAFIIKRLLIKKQQRKPKRWTCFTSDRFWYNLNFEVIICIMNTNIYEGLWKSGCIDPRFTSINPGTIWGEWSASSSDRFTPSGGSPGTQWIEGWVGPIAGLDDVEKLKFFTLPGPKLRSLCCSVAAIRYIDCAISARMYIYCPVH
jgi:hypothetical protein